MGAEESGPEVRRTGELDSPSLAAPDAGVSRETESDAMPEIRTAGDLANLDDGYDPDATPLARAAQHSVHVDC